MVNFRTKYCNSGVPNSSSKHSKTVNNNFLILKKDQLKVLSNIGEAKKLFSFNTTSFHSTNFVYVSIVMIRVSICVPFFYKQSIFDPRPKNCLSFSKKSSQKLFSGCLVDGLLISIV